MPNSIATSTSFKSGCEHRYWKGGTDDYWHRYAREITNCPKGLIVHHKDGNVKNNNLDNLQICTQSEHVAIHNKQRKGKIKEGSILRKNFHKVINLKKMKKRKEIAEELGISERMVKRIINLKNKGGYYVTP